MDADKKFYLSHRWPVNPPIESAVTHDASALTAAKRWCDVSRFARGNS